LREKKTIHHHVSNERSSEWVPNLH